MIPCDTDRTSLGAARCALCLVLLACAQAGGPADGTNASPGRSEYLIGSWRAEDGLPQNSVTCVVQTRDGYLWLGTFNGLARFDGVRFVAFGAHNTPELRSNRILSLLEDRNGGLWIGTEGGGVTRWEAGRFTNFTVWEGLAHDTVQCLAEDASGRILIGTPAGLSVWHDGRLITIEKTEGIGEGAVRAAAVDAQGRCGLLVGQSVGWLDSGHGPMTTATGVAARQGMVGLHRGASGTVWLFGKGVLAPLGPEPEASRRAPALDPELQVQAVLESRTGDLWIATRLGQLLRWRAEQWLAVSILEEVGQHPVRCLAEDWEGNLWVGTDGGGLVRLKPRRLTNLRARDGLLNEFILSMAEDDAGGVWLGAHCGGLRLWRGESAQPWTADGALLPGACVGPLLRTRDGSLWVGTSGEGLFRWRDGRATRFGRTQGLPDPTILSLFEDREGRLWIGTAESGVFQWQEGRFQNFTMREGFPAQRITAIVQDQEGDLWIGSNGGGLYRYASGKFSFYSRREGWGGDFIRALLVDTEGALWIGTGGSGLTRMKDGWFHTLTARDGLSDDVVSQILEDDFGNLWIGCNRGICRVNKQAFEDFAAGRSPTVSVAAYGKSEGMESLECTGGIQPAGLKTRDGTLWFPTVKGAVILKPASLAGPGALDRDPHDPASRRRSPVPPSVVIEEVWVDGERLPEAVVRGLSAKASGGRLPDRPPAVGRIAIHPDYKRLEIRYTALSFTAPEKVRFRYRLDGLDADWVEAGENRTARFGKLPSGDYRFRVIACNSEGVWDESSVALPLTLRPHFWQTRWFFAGTLFAAGSLAAGALRMRERGKLRRALARLEQQHAVEQERRRIAQDMHDELGSRLAKLSFVCELAKANLGQPAELGTRVASIADISQTVLATLDEMVWAVNPQNDTLEHLAAYIGEYAKEFFQATQIQCEVRMPVSLPARALAAETRHHLFLAVQEALTNVLKHAGASQVRLTMAIEPQSFAIAIEDNGRGFVVPPWARAGADAGPPPTPPGARNGLINMRLRLDAIGARFWIERRESGGTTVNFALPL